MSFFENSKRGQAMILNVKNPPITTMPHYADALACISCLDHGMNWYYSNYIQIYTDYRWVPYGEIFFRDNLFWVLKHYNDFSYAYNPFIASWQSISDITLYVEKSNIVNTFENLINNEHYIIANVDLHYLNTLYPPGVIHTIFIYGYDEESFKVADFTRGGRYGFNDLNKVLLEESYSSEYEMPNYSQHRNHVAAFMLQDVEYSFDLELVKKQLVDYYNENDSLNSYEYTRYHEKIATKFLWGMGCYSNLISYLLKMNSEFKAIDHRSLYALCDHKKAMVDRLEYMIEQNHIEDCSIRQEFENLYQELVRGLNMLLKYNISGDEKIIVRLVNLLRNIYDNEKKSVEKLLKELDAR